MYNQYFFLWEQGGKGKRVRLTFDDFEVTQTPECSGDFLLVSQTGELIYGSSFSIILDMLIIKPLQTEMVRKSENK